MNCPGHMLLFASQLRSYRELPFALRRSRPRCTATSSPARCTVCCASRHVTQDDAHIFCTPEQIEDEIDALFDYRDVPLRPIRRARVASAELCDPARQQARHRRGVGLHRGRAAERRSTARDSRTAIARGRGRVLRAEDRLCTSTDALGRPWQMGTIQLDGQHAGAARPARYVGADNAEHTPYVIHRALFGSFERFIGILIEHYGGAFPFWLAPVQIRILPVGEAHREAAEALAAKLAGYRVEVDGSDDTRRQADPQRRGGEDPLRDRLRRQGVRRLARRPRARRQAAHDLAFGASERNLLLSRSESRERTASSPPGHEAYRRFNRVVTTRKRGRCLQRFSSSKEEDRHDLVRAS